MDFKLDDWVRHPKFGDGQIMADLGNKYRIQFVNCGERLILKSAIDSAGQPPHAGFRFATLKASKTSQRKASSVAAPSFDHLVKRFLDVFKAGFDSESFQPRERTDKLEAAGLLHATLGKQQLRELLAAGDFQEVTLRISRVVQRTKMMFRQEIIKLNAALKLEHFQQQFGEALWEVLYGDAEPEARFNAFTQVLANGGAANWPAATYFQFLESNGERMFMKPHVTQKMAKSLNVALNYKPEPNWLTYCKLQELAKRVDEELRTRGLKPWSGIDVQGFIWAAIKIEEDKYGGDEQHASRRSKTPPFVRKGGTEHPF
jgi:hypothetical protein